MLQVLGLVKPVRVAKMPGSVCRVGFEPAAVVIELGTHSPAIPKDAMTVRVVLEIQAARGQRSGLVGCNQMQYASATEALVVEAEPRSEAHQQLVLLPAGEPARQRKRLDCGRGSLPAGTIQNGWGWKYLRPLQTLPRPPLPQQISAHEVGNRHRM